MGHPCALCLYAEFYLYLYLLSMEEGTSFSPNRKKNDSGCKKFALLFLPENRLQGPIRTLEGFWL
ncbi:MAG: hypothetical protein CMF59_18980 [Leptospiraceae bacterium]|nr:hypothetical protein [Leptospiraceae bacterium]